MGNNFNIEPKNNIQVELKNFFHFRTILLLFILFISVFINLTFQNNKSVKNSTKNTNQDITKNTKNNSTKKIILKKYSLSPVQWKNYLFLPTHDVIESNQTRQIKITRLDLSTDERKVIYEETDSYNDSYNDRVINSLVVIDNNLFFTFSSGMRGKNPEMYRLNLESNDLVPNKLFTGNDENLGIIHVNDKYYVDDYGISDMCGSSEQYYSFDPHGLKLIKSFLLKGSCNGEDSEGFDYLGRMIVTTFSNGFDFENFHYKSLSVVDMDNSTVRTNLIDNSFFVKNIIKNINYSQEINKILITGKNISVYDLKTDKFSEIMKMSNDLIDSDVDYWDDNLICLNSDRTKIDLKTKTISSNNQFCIDKVNEIKNKPNVDISQINLPPGYQFVLE